MSKKLLIAFFLNFIALLPIQAQLPRDTEQAEELQSKLERAKKLQKLLEKNIVGLNALSAKYNDELISLKKITGSQRDEKNIVELEKLIADVEKRQVEAAQDLNNTLNYMEELNKQPLNENRQAMLQVPDIKTQRKASEDKMTTLKQEIENLNTTYEMRNNTLQRLIENKASALQAANSDEKEEYELQIVAAKSLVADIQYERQLKRRELKRLLDHIEKLKHQEAISSELNVSIPSAPEKRK